MNDEWYAACVSGQQASSAVPLVIDFALTVRIVAIDSLLNSHDLTH